MSRSLLPCLAVLVLAGCGGRVENLDERRAAGGAAATTPSNRGGSVASADGVDGGASAGGGAADEPEWVHPCLDLQDMSVSECGWHTIELANRVSGCVFELAFLPDDPTKINVAIDCLLVPTVGADDAVNYRLDSGGTLYFEGEPCSRLRNGEVAVIDILQGCSPMH